MTTQTTLFRIRLWLAEHLGFYRYEGAISFAALRGYPLARVQYPDGARSVKMAIGNAVDYQNIFGGKVVAP